MWLRRLLGYGGARRYDACEHRLYSNGRCDGRRNDGGTEANSAADLDLAHRLNHLPKRLSTGERQRVAIARATAANPRPASGRAHREPRTRAGCGGFRPLTPRRAALIVSTHDLAVREAFAEVVELGRRGGFEFGKTCNIRLSFRESKFEARGREVVSSN